jgi:hypothetical protein
MKVLSDAQSNTKMAKSMGKGYLLAGLSLRPADASGWEVCPFSIRRNPFTGVLEELSCRKVCVLEHSGRGNMANVQQGRDDKTERLFTSKAAFLADLHSDLRALQRKADKEGLQAVCRLNVASDIVWEKRDPSIFTEHPRIIFYDYTKSYDRAAGKLPSNYHLTYSFNEWSDHSQVTELLTIGRNVACVFDTFYQRNGKEEYHRVDDLPSTYAIGGFNFPVVDGDGDDIRIPELDGCGVIVGLRGKGGQDLVLEGVKGGFILPTVGGRLALASK